MRQYVPSLITPFAVLVCLIDSIDSSEHIWTIGQFEDETQANQLVDAVLSGGVISKIRIHKLKDFGINEETGRTWMYGEITRLEGDWGEDE